MVGLRATRRASGHRGRVLAAWRIVRCPLGKSTGTARLLWQAVGSMCSGTAHSTGGVTGVQQTAMLPPGTGLDTTTGPLTLPHCVPGGLPEYVTSRCSPPGIMTNRKSRARVADPRTLPRAHLMKYRNYRTCAGHRVKPTDILPLSTSTCIQQTELRETKKHDKPTAYYKASPHHAIHRAPQRTFCQLHKLARTRDFLEAVEEAFVAQPLPAINLHLAAACQPATIAPDSPQQAAC